MGQRYGLGAAGAVLWAFGGGQIQPVLWRGPPQAIALAFALPVYLFFPGFSDSERPSSPPG